jgi:DNA-binding response OmpR family regulator
VAANAALAVIGDSSEYEQLASELSSAGIAVTRAVSALDAVLQHVASPAGVIICDTDSVDWKQALELFRKYREQIAVVFLSRQADEHLWVEMLSAGAFDVLRKPCLGEELRRVAATALGPAAGHAVP